MALCSRLVDAYASSQADHAPAPAGMWSHEVFQRRQRPLLRVLHNRDAAALADLLAGMFRADFVLGMAPGSLGVGELQLVTKFACLNALNKLVALAESQGAVQVENPEQGAVGIAFANGCERLVANTEQRLGVSLDFPDVGATYGIRIGGRLISWDTPDQLYAAARLLEAMRTYIPAPRAPLRVVEIGAGYGGMAYWLLQMTALRYVIVDLPAVNVLQGYFLSQALGDSEVSFYGEPAARVAILPTHALADIDLPFDVLANKDSMPEIPEPALLEYLMWAQAGCRGIFYSYNQEAGAPFDGTPQNVVPDVLARIGGFTRLRRDASWLRRGYAEEIYMAPESARNAAV
ncbi:MAG TPA: putative sugar O-methyltransferase [Solirubrobacteraceae bacterium]|nr:putative sugar O-methyltransferase [Solirubrobacteraceae bacterium]